MHEGCVPPRIQGLTDRLSPVAKRHALAVGGGTACALRLGHRTSADLDFFSLLPLATESLLSELDAVGERRLRGISASELTLTVEGVELSATALGREPINATEEWRGLSVLGLTDLAELKAEAAVMRGMLRDLCDLHLLCVAGADLGLALRAGRVDPVVALKALTDVGRFERQPPLDLRLEWSAEGAVAYFEEEARQIIRALGG